MDCHVVALLAMTNMQMQYLTTQERRLAYHLSEGTLPTVIFMGGFKSDMQGAKATTLEAFCHARGQRFIRFDYSGHGESSGDFKDGTIGAWKEDALAIIDQLGSEVNILVGSSMGAWMALLCSIARPNKVRALIGIAAAPDFTEELIWKKLTTEQQSTLEKEGVYYAPSCYGEEPYPITKRLIEEARNHLLLSPSPLRGEGWGEGVSPHTLTSQFNAPPPHPLPVGERGLAITCPVRLIHGDKDADVPWQHSVRLMEVLESDDVQLRLIKGGDHRLSSKEQLQVLVDTVERALQQVS